jgi:hypothetical protein
MFICEEYVQRHKIKMPIIKRISFGSLFFKTDNSMWKMLTITWKEPHNHPGYYNIRILNPIHDGGTRGRCTDLITEDEIYVDEYEEFVLDFLKTVKKVPTTRKEACNAAWEFSLYIFDTEIAKIANSFLSQSFLILDLDIHQREGFIHWLVGKVPLFREFWSGEILRTIDNHQYWMGELKNGLLAN